MLIRAAVGIFLLVPSRGLVWVGKYPSAQLLSLHLGWVKPKAVGLCVDEGLSRV